MSRLFNRTYRLEIDGNGQTVKIEGLRFEFRCRKTRSTSPNELSIRVTNPSKATRLQAFDADATVRLFAGYGDNTPLLAQSQTTRVEVEEGDIETVLVIECMDGINSLRKTRVSLSYEAGATVEQVLDAVSAKLGFPLRPVEANLGVPLAGGYSHAGGVGQALDDLCGRVGAGWSIQNGDLLILGPDGRTKTQAVLLSPSTGLINSPSPIEDSVNTFAIGENLRGWQVQALLQPTLEPGDIIRLESKEIEGLFVIDEIEHSGDTHGQDWYSTLTVFE